MVKKIAHIALMFVAMTIVACGSLDSSGDGSTTFSCTSIFLCKYRASSFLEESEVKWKNLKLTKYSYSGVPWHADEPPPCDDDVIVNVKDSRVQSAEITSCETKQKTMASISDLKTMMTVEENYNYCRDKVLKEAPLFSKIVFKYDKKGVLAHCHFYEKYWGKSAGGRVLYGD